MKKNIQYLVWTLIALCVAVGFNSCSDDSSGNNAYGNLKATFDKMKGSYKGQMAMPDNGRQEVTFSIDQQANVVLASFPLNNVLSKIYPNDYQRVTPSGDAFSYSCPIDSVGIPADGQLQFVTKEDFSSNRVDFSYTLKKPSGEQEAHSGYMLVKTRGLYNSLMNSLTINFVVTDLFVDTQDLTSSLCPIDNYIDIASKQQ